MMASKLQEICNELDIGLIYKSSFDKANRTSNSSYRGPGLDDSLEILNQVKIKTGLPILTDVPESS